MIRCHDLYENGTYIGVGIWMINIMGDLVQYHSWWGLYGLKIPRPTTANKFIMLLQRAEISRYPYARTILMPSSASTDPTSRSAIRHSSHSVHFLLRSYHKCPTSRVHSPTVVSLQIIGREERVLVSIVKGVFSGRFTLVFVRSSASDT